MRNIAFTFLLLVCYAFVGAQSTVTIPPKDTIVQPIDSIPVSYNWSVRAPLSAEAQQKKEDDRAHVEEMKRRFRDFHQTEKSEQRSTEAADEDQNYLWSDAEQGGGEMTPRGVPASTPNQQESENLRMEIGRNLQEGKSTTNTSGQVFRPASPQQASTPNTDIQADVNAAFQRKAIDQDNWETRLTPEAQLSLAGLTEGQSIIVPELRFMPQSSELAPPSIPNLDNWGALLLQQPALKIEVRAYTSDNLNPMDALNLSAERAKVIVDYWLAQGATIKQLSYRGYGALSPLVPADSALAQQKNERIELIILELPKR